MEARRQRLRISRRNRLLDRERLQVLPRLPVLDQRQPVSPRRRSRRHRLSGRVELLAAVPPTDIAGVPYGELEILRLAGRPTLVMLHGFGIPSQAAAARRQSPLTNT